MYRIVTKSYCILAMLSSVYHAVIVSWWIFLSDYECLSPSCTMYYVHVLCSPTKDEFAQTCVSIPVQVNSQQNMLIASTNQLQFLDEEWFHYTINHDSWLISERPQLAADSTTPQLRHQIIKNMQCFSFFQLVFLFQYFQLFEYSLLFFCFRPYQSHVVGMTSA